MRRGIALLLVTMLVMGCTAAFAGTMQEEMDKAGSTIHKFFTDLGELVMDKIPNTYKDLSPTGTKQTQGTATTTTTTTKSSTKYLK
ncbi:MAG: hypothetical protein WBD24_05405 [Candidatus Omnitrophota bacterium]